MSLILYDAHRFKDDLPNDIKEDDIVRNVEEEFKKLHIQKSDAVCKVIKEIEGAEYLDESYFIDKFGIKVPLQYLSSGSKAALCVIFCKDKIIDGRECALNARDAIIHYCTEGKFIAYGIGDVSVCNYDHDECDMVFLNKEYKSIEDFNYYIDYGIWTGC